MANRKSSKHVRASELGEYLFCALAWRLRREGVEPTSGHAAREAGRRWHEGHGRFVARASRLRRLSAATFYLALAVAAFALLSWWLGR